MDTAGFFRVGATVWLAISVLISVRPENHENTKGRSVVKCLFPKHYCDLSGHRGASRYAATLTAQTKRNSCGKQGDLWVGLSSRAPPLENWWFLKCKTGT